MTEPPQYPSAPDPNLPPSAATPPPTPPYGGYGTPPGTPPPPPPAPPAYGAPQYGPPAYDVMAAVSYGWRGFKANAGTFLLLGILAIVIPGIVSFVGSAFNAGGSALADGTSSSMRIGFGATGGLLGFVFSIAAQVLSLFFTAASIRAAFDVTEGRRVDLGAAFTRWNKGQVILLAVLVSIGTMVGFILCVLPGIVFLFFTWFGMYFVVGNAQSAVEAIGSSFRFTADNLGNLLLLFLMAILIGLLGALACLVGLLVAIPLLTIAAAYTFRFLQGQMPVPVA
ncbi:hypothetical protein GCM10011584_17740 [Nocardioides phosphati]|uniref:Integral membrane protein n=1 Tax=Nocardioides phosphati TaxID=1867775 RepID=A0ABQ2N956_9ACTN|nr:hypothetical protein [Nocardioides phosphati]GGO89114.1 hypothetical protein GCM10011584_17740 [Nocardioides phosphati]